MEYKLVAIKVGKREDSATKVQGILTSFGCSIKVRLGLHDLPEGVCSPAGLIILQVNAEDSEISKFVDELNSISDVVARSLTI